MGCFRGVLTLGNDICRLRVKRRVRSPFLTVFRGFWRGIKDEFQAAMILLWILSSLRLHSSSFSPMEKRVEFLISAEPLSVKFKSRSANTEISRWTSDNKSMVSIVSSSNFRSCIYVSPCFFMRALIVLSSGLLLQREVHKGADKLRSVGSFLKAHGSGCAVWCLLCEAELAR